MVLRNRDSRRLRVILDESTDAELEPSSGLAATADPSNSAGEADSHRPRRMYGFGAERRSQPKTTDMIPKRWLAYLTLVVLLVGAVAALNTMAIYAASLQAFIGEAGVAACSLQGSGTFTSWFTTILLGAAAAFCLQVYYLRKHRCDDYHGSYRLWFWASTVFLVGSVSGTIGLGQILQNVVFAAAGELPSFGPFSVFVLAAFTLLTAMLLLGIWETRASRGSTALIIAAWLAGSCSMLEAIPQFQDQITRANLTLVTANGWPVFASCLFLAVLTYARHVYLAANGMLPLIQVTAKPAKSVAKKKVAKPKVAAKKKTTAKPVSKKSSSAASKAKVVASSDTPKNRMQQIREQAVAKKSAGQKAAAKQKSAQVLSMDDAATSEEQPKLSKAERRRQRKLERRQNRAA